jgi:hypothetical protein
MDEIRGCLVVGACIAFLPVEGCTAGAGKRVRSSNTIVAE